MTTRDALTALRADVEGMDDCSRVRAFLALIDARLAALPEPQMTAPKTGCEPKDAEND